LGADWLTVCGLELEAAASQVQHAASRGALADRLRKPVKASAAVFLDLEQARFTQDTQVLRDVVGRHLESSRNLTDVECFVDQQPNDPDPGVFREGSQCRDTVVPLHNGKQTMARSQLVKLSG